MSPRERLLHAARELLAAAGAAGVPFRVEIATEDGTVCLTYRGTAKEQTSRPTPPPKPAAVPTPPPATASTELLPLLPFSAMDLLVLAAIPADGWVSAGKVSEALDENPEVRRGDILAALRNLKERNALASMTGRGYTRLIALNP